MDEFKVLNTRANALQGLLYHVKFVSNCRKFQICILVSYFFKVEKVVFFQVVGDVLNPPPRPMAVLAVSCSQFS